MLKPVPVLLLIGCCALAAPALWSQAETGIVRAPDGGIQQQVDGIFIPPVQGAPFTAKVVVEIRALLPDGATIARKYYTLVARDSQGRVHRENRGILPADSDKEPPLHYTFVNDPLTRTRTTCVPAQQTCWITKFVPIVQSTLEPAGLSANGKSYLAREDLGASTLDDLEVLHSRETRTFNAGAFGNDRPVVVTKDFWYSPRLQINLAVTRDDPRTAIQKLNVTDLILGEPEPSWFASPQGFKVIDQRSSGNPIGLP